MKLTLMEKCLATAAGTQTSEPWWMISAFSVTHGTIDIDRTRILL
jgi:hypothetical protein